jgi:N-methylhydantoinase A
MEAAARPGRQVYVQGAWHDALVYDRLGLPVGAVIPGPAILEQSDATTFIDPGLAGRVDAFGNVIVEREK